MSQPDASEQFDLARFVLGYLEHGGSLLTPPAYGVHEALLPDALARGLQVDSYLRLAFAAAFRGTEADAAGLHERRDLQCRSGLSG